MLCGYYAARIAPALESREHPAAGAFSYIYTAAAAAYMTAPKKRGKKCPNIAEVGANVGQIDKRKIANCLFSAIYDFIK